MYYTLKTLTQSSVFYTFANSIEALSPIVLAVILTRTISPEEYGVWVLFIALVTFARPFTNLSAQDALRMHYFEMDDRAMARLIWSSFCLGGICTSTIIVLLLAFSDQISSLIGFPKPWLTAIPITAFCYASFYFLLAYYQFARRRKTFLYLHLVQTATSLGLIVFLVFGYRNWQSIIVGKNAGLLLAIVFGLVCLARYVDLNAAMRSRPQLRQLSTFGLMYLPTGLGMVAIPLTDRIIVSKILGMAENGLYGAVALFGSVLFVGINGFLHAWMPWLFKTLSSSPQEKRAIPIVSIIFFLLLPIAGGLFSYIAAFIAPLVIGKEFTEKLNLIPWAIAGTISMGYFLHNQAFLHYRKAIFPMSLCSIMCVVFNAYFSYYGAIKYGSKGVFAATIIAFLAAAVMSACFGLSRARVISHAEVRVHAGQ